MILFAAAIAIQHFLNEDVCFQLEAMEMADQEMRMRGIDLMKHNKVTKEFVREQNEIDHRNTEQLKQIVFQIGWPTISRYGRKCSHTTWLLVQHADLDRTFQRHCLELMKPLLASHEVEPQDYAYLCDRVVSADTGKQLYGNAFEIKNGALILKPVIDPKHLDKRRREIGLMPMKDYIRLMEEMYGLKLKTKNSR